jgi:hypothetical protein
VRGKREVGRETDVTKKGEERMARIKERTWKMSKEMGDGLSW